MPGTPTGGRKAAAANLARDPEFYKKIGAIGGRNGHTGGFAANPELASIAGTKGGQISKRRPSPKKLSTAVQPTPSDEAWHDAIDTSLAE
jgi:hypothetical protein